MAKIYILSSVRNASKEDKKAIEEYVAILEDQGHEVHNPNRDTKQDDTGINICMNNILSISFANEVHIAWDDASIGSHFDLGAVFLEYIKRSIHNEEFKVKLVPGYKIKRTDNKSFRNVILDLVERTKE